MIKFNINTKSLESAVGRAVTFVQKEAPITAGNMLVRQIKVLSQQQQKSYTDESFAPLTKEYKAYKISKGKAGVPNLTFTGRYMASIQPRTVEGKMIVAPSDEKQGQAEGLDAKRPHIGVHPNTIRNFETAFTQQWNNQFK